MNTLYKNFHYQISIHIQNSDQSQKNSKILWYWSLLMVEPLRGDEISEIITHLIDLKSEFWFLIRVGLTQEWMKQTDLLYCQVEIQEYFTNKILTCPYQILQRTYMNHKIEVFERFRAMENGEYETDWYSDSEEEDEELN